MTKKRFSKPSPGTSRKPELSRFNIHVFSYLLLFAFVVTLALLAGTASFLISRQAFHSGSLRFNVSAPKFIQQLNNIESAQNSDSSATGKQAGNIDPSASLTNLTPWDGAGRVTILIMGLDYRDWSSKEKYSRSDTMILLTFDPLTKSAGILSIPRDMWVPIPGFDHGKINTAYFLGEAYNLPGGGPGLAIKTVEQFLGVPINYYAIINFDTFVKFIDEIGGVKIDIPNKITIDLLGDGSATKKTLKPGVQVLPGEWALAYARNRHTENGDFDRAERQQQVIMAIKDRILTFNMLPGLIAKAPRLYRELKSGIDTNMTLDEAIKLALLIPDLSDEEIQKAVIGKDQVIFGRSPDNLSILIPLPDKIHLIRDQIFSSQSGLNPETPGDERQKMVAESARLAIYNGTNRHNLADRTAEFLKNAGVNVNQVNSAPDSYSSTVIIDHTGNPYLVKYLVDLMQISPKNIHSDFNPTSPSDVELFLGNDWTIESTAP